MTSTDTDSAHERYACRTAGLPDCFDVEADYVNQDDDVPTSEYLAMLDTWWMAVDSFAGDTYAEGGDLGPVAAAAREWVQARNWTLRRIAAEAGYTVPGPTAEVAGCVNTSTVVLDLRKAVPVEE